MAITLVSEVIHTSNRLVQFYQCDSTDDIEKLKTIVSRLSSEITVSQFVQERGQGCATVLILDDDDIIYLKLAVS